jgi:hypothetical protein
MYVSTCKRRIIPPRRLGPMHTAWLMERNLWPHFYQLEKGLTKATNSSRKMRVFAVLLGYFPKPGSFHNSQNLGLLLLKKKVVPACSSFFWMKLLVRDLLCVQPRTQLRHGGNSNCSAGCRYDCCNRCFR